MPDLTRFIHFTTHAVSAAPDAHTRRRAVALLALLWTAGFGLGTANALAILTGHGDDLNHPTGWTTAAAWVDTVVFLLLAGATIALATHLTTRSSAQRLTSLIMGGATLALFCRLVLGLGDSRWSTPLALATASYWVCRWADSCSANALTPPRTGTWWHLGPAWSTTLLLTGACYLLDSLPQRVVTLLLLDAHIRPTFHPAHYPASSSSYANAALAGLKEEPILTAAAVILARRANWNWPRTLLTALALRVAFHLYYGWHTLTLLPWAVAALALWCYTRNLWAPIISHGIFDTAITLDNQLHTQTTSNICLILAILTTCVLAWKHRHVIPDLDWKNRRLIHHRTSPTAKK